MRMAVQHGDDRGAPLRGEEHVEDRVVALAESLPRLQRAEDEVG